MGILCLVIIGRGNMPGGNFITFNKYSYDKEKKRSAVIGIARKEIGVREFTENSSKRIDEYNATVGFKKVAWCASFVCWCFKEAGLAQPRTAWSPGLFPEGRLVNPSLPSTSLPRGARDVMQGLLIGIYFPSLGRIAHCGIIERVQGSMVFSIEGNTNVTGSRDGDAVMRKARHKRSIAKYADWL